MRPFILYSPRASLSGIDLPAVPLKPHKNIKKKKRGTKRDGILKATSLFPRRRPYVDVCVCFQTWLPASFSVMRDAALLPPLIVSGRGKTATSRGQTGRNV